MTSTSTPSRSTPPPSKGSNALRRRSGRSSSGDLEVGEPKPGNSVGRSPGLASVGASSTGIPAMSLQSTSAVKAQDKDKGAHSFVIRTTSAVFMLGAYVVLSYYGQTLCIFLVLGCIIAMFREILRIVSQLRADNRIPGFRFLPWYFLLVSIFYLYLRTLRKPLIKTWPNMEFILRHVSFVCFFLYVLGFMYFVCSLKAKFYKYQFAQLAWTHMAIFYIVLQGTCFIHNMLEGMIWFLLPTSLIICNDIFAYLCGKNFGKHSLIAISPKKTWEGFIGAFILTIILGFYLSYLFALWEHMICPKDSFLNPVTCEASSLFLPREYSLPKPCLLVLRAVGLHKTSINLYPIQLHSLSFSAFASLVAPFGGFFASGLKRAFKIKDFGDVIPGHGGVTDRMDCQLLIATFTMLYLNNFVRSQGGFCSNMSLISHCTRRLPLKDQIRLYHDLASRLIKLGVPLVTNATLPGGV